MPKRIYWSLALLIIVGGLLFWQAEMGEAAGYLVGYGYLPVVAVPDSHPLQATPPPTATLTVQPAPTEIATTEPPTAAPPAATSTATTTATMPPAAATVTLSPTVTRTPVWATATPEPFTFSKVEPNRIIRETGGSVSIYGSGFTTGTAVRLVGFGLLDTVVVNSTAVKALVPPGVPEGRYSIEVILSNGASLRKDDVIRIRSGEEEPTPTYTPGPLLAYGKPEVVIQSAGTEPDGVRAGGFFTLSLSVINRGDYTATSVQVAVNAEGLAVPRGATNTVIFDTMATNEPQTVEFPLALSEDATNGYHSLGVTLSYKDYYGREYSSEQSVGVNVSSATTSQPLVLLTAYSTEPVSLSPGDAFILHLEITNVGQTTAAQVLVTLGGQDGSGTRPFALLDAGNVKFIQRLAAGESLDLEQRIILDGAAESGVYNLPVTLEYETMSGARESETQNLNLLVSRRPQLQIDYFEPPNIGLVGEPVDLLIEVVNIGRNLVNVSTLEVDGQDLEVLQGTSFIGALDGGTSGSLDASVIPQRSGELSVNVTVNYLDDFNQPQQITETLSLMVEKPAAPPPGQEQAVDGGGDRGGFLSGLWRFIRGLFGLGS